MIERLPAPKPIPHDEWTKTEAERGETFPEHITPLRARIKTPEQQEKFKELTERANAIAGELFENWPEPWMLDREQLNEIVQRYEPQLTNIAAESRIFADSYRQFDVGALLIGYQDTRTYDPVDRRMHYPSNNGRPNPWRILFDANTRPETDEGVVQYQRGAHELGRHSEVRKHCAELNLSDRVDQSKPEFGLPEEKLDKAIALFVVGKAQVDDDSKIKQITLTCCKLCRDRLWKMTLNENDEGGKQVPVYTKDMPVISADARNLNNRKWQPVSELHNFHKELPSRHQEL